MDTIGNVFSGVKNAVGSVASGVGNVLGSIGSGIGSVVGGIADTVGGIFSGGGDSGGGGGWLSDIGSSIGDMFGGWFANGGTLGAGKWGIAGENGPELFVPKGSGTIIPSGATSQMMGNQTVVNNYSINAIDTKSFEERLRSEEHTSELQSH